MGVVRLLRADFCASTAKDHARVQEIRERGSAREVCAEKNETMRLRTAASLKCLLPFTVALIPGTLGLNISIETLKGV